MLRGIKKAIAFFAHTDDEMIAAGTLHRLVREGCEVHVVAFGPAAVEWDRMGNKESEKVVIPEWHNALDIIGIGPHNRKYDDYCCLPSAKIPDNAQRIADGAYHWCESYRPDLAVILSPHDENTAHAVVGRECERVMRGRVPHVWRCIFPWNYSGERPNLYVRLEAEDVEVKRKVINAYQSQKFRYRYLEMLMAQVVVDGLSVKVPAAEKFEIVRSVV